MKRTKKEIKKSIVEEFEKEFTPMKKVSLVGDYDYGPHHHYEILLKDNCRSTLFIAVALDTSGVFAGVFSVWNIVGLDGCCSTWMTQSILNAIDKLNQQKVGE